MRFTDPETQRMFCGLLDSTTNLTKNLDSKKLKKAYFDFEESMSSFISHVESRLRREAEPCEWEKNPVWRTGGLKKAHIDPMSECLRYNEFKFCPACGRKLEEK